MRFMYPSEKERDENAKAFKEVFVSFPGGLIDWAAFGVVLIFPFAVFIISVIYFELQVDWLMTEFGLIALFITVAVGVYVYIYIYKIEWIVTRVSKWKKNNMID